MSEISGNGGTSKAKTKASGGGGVARTLTRIVAYYVILLGAAAGSLVGVPFADPGDRGSRR